MSVPFGTICSVLWRERWALSRSCYSCQYELAQKILTTSFVMPNSGIISRFSSSWLYTLPHQRKKLTPYSWDEASEMRWRCCKRFSPCRLCTANTRLYSSLDRNLLLHSKLVSAPIMPQIRGKCLFVIVVKLFCEYFPRCLAPVMFWRTANEPPRWTRNSRYELFTWRTPEQTWIVASRFSQSLILELKRPYP